MSEVTPLPEPKSFWPNIAREGITLADCQAYGKAERERALEDAAQIAAVRWDVLKETEAAHYRLSNQPFNVGNFGMNFTLAEESRDIAYAIRELKGTP
jgi:hypothetical protein